MLTVTADHSAFKDSIQELYRHFGQMQPIMESIGMELEGRISGRFESRTDPAGVAWHPWLQSTKDSYPFEGTPAAAKHGVGNGRLLDRYDGMIRGLNHQADDSSVRVGFDKGYSSYHEFGTEHMSRRGLLFGDPEAGKLGKDDEQAVLDVLGDWLNRITA